MSALIGAGIVMLGPFSLAIYTPALPELAATFATSPALIQLTVSIYFLGFACAQLICGPLSDGFGRRPVAICFFSIYALGGLLGVMAPNVEWLLVACALQGVGVTAGIGISRAIVRDQFAGREAARILNLISITLGAGPAIAPTLAGAACGVRMARGLCCYASHRGGRGHHAVNASGRDQS
jgi:DHA1 family bicyclomycin/chloramphenicol resistance-like MFS transporter